MISLVFCYRDTLVLVLMHDKDVEPGVCVLQGSLELDGLLLESEVQPLVLNVPDAIECHFCQSPLEKYRRHLNFFDVFDLPEVVEVVIDAGLVQTGEHVQPRRVVVVAVDAENRQLDTQRAVQVVRFRILVGFELSLFEPGLPENVLVEDFRGLVTI